MIPIVRRQIPSPRTTIQVEEAEALEELFVEDR